MRYYFYFFAAMGFLLLLSGIAEATKPSYSCANVRCGYGTSCVETRSGPVCQPVYTPPPISCHNIRCASGYECVETRTGPECRPQNYGLQNQSCAYGGYYHYGQLICNPAPSWRHPYQNGWGHYDHLQHYRPPQHRNRPPWHYYGNVPERAEPAPSRPTMCPMNYDPVCGEKPVVCVRAPCLAIRKTFGNACQASAEEFTVLYKGVCQ